MKRILMLTLTFLLPATAMAEEGIHQAIDAFATAGDQQDVEAAGRWTHEDFRVVFQMEGSHDTTLMDRSTYLSLLEQKKLGGGHRKVEVVAIQQRGSLANAHVRMTRADAHFEGVMTLVKEDGAWKLIQDATVFSPKET